MRVCAAALGLFLVVALLVLVSVDPVSEMEPRASGRRHTSQTPAVATPGSLAEPDRARDDGAEPDDVVSDAIKNDKIRDDNIKNEDHGKAVNLEQELAQLSFFHSMQRLTPVTVGPVALTHVNASDYAIVFEGGHAKWAGFDLLSDEAQGVALELFDVTVNVARLRMKFAELLITSGQAPSYSEISDSGLMYKQGYSKSVGPGRESYWIDQKQFEAMPMISELRQRKADLKHDLRKRFGEFPSISMGLSMNFAESQ